MKHKHLFLSAGVIVLALSLCSCASTNGKYVRIDEVPLYGGMDRTADERFRAGDEEFIRKVSEKWGSREAAARAWVDQGFNFYFRDELGMAMRRFNQAWLLDPKNPEVYHGFGSVLYDQGDVCGAMEMFDKGLELEWTAPTHESGFLADAAKMISYCAVDQKNNAESSEEEYSKLIEKSDALFLRAEALEEANPELHDGYLYANWWMALYVRGEYAQAWDKVFLMRERGGELRGNFVQGLKDAMPEPVRK